MNEKYKSSALYAYVKKYGNGTRKLSDNSYVTVCETDTSVYGEVLFHTDLNETFWHRLDGPAYIKFKDDGSPEDCQWYINDFYVTDIITDWAKDNDIDLDNLTEVDKALIKLTWADYYGK